MDSKLSLPHGMEVRAPLQPAHARVLTADALAFVAKLCREFEPRRQELLAARAARQREFDAGRMPDFLPGTREVRESSWTIKTRLQWRVTARMASLSSGARVRRSSTDASMPSAAS